MTSHNFLAALALVPGVIVFVELFFRLPVVRQAQSIRINAAKALKVILSSRISDHWKEKSIPVYAVRILLSSLLGAFYLAVTCLVSGAIFGLAGFVLLKNMPALMDFFLSIRVQVGLVVIGMLYVWLRRKIQGRIL